MQCTVYSVVSISAVHSLQCCVNQCSAQFAVSCQCKTLIQSRNFHTLPEVSFSDFIRAPEANPSLYFRGACFDVAASAQTDQQFCDFMRIREYAETDSSREESQRTTDSRECGVGTGKSWFVN